MFFIPLIAIPITFLASVLIKPFLEKYIPWNLCAICVAVTSTWTLLLTLSGFGFKTDPLFLAVLMGMSVTGIMYVIEKAYIHHRLRLLWLARLMVVLGGFYGLVTFLQGRLNTAFIIVILTIILLTIVSFLAQGVTHEDALQTANADDHKKSLLKKLDNCC